MVDVGLLPETETLWPKSAGVRTMYIVEFLDRVGIPYPVLAVPCPSTLAVS